MKDRGTLTGGTAATPEQRLGRGAAPQRIITIILRAWAGP
jgi:hypothetical protein